MADEKKNSEFKVSALRQRMSARKARLVADAVRGRSAVEAAELLQFVHRRAAPVIKKLIESAMANAEDYGNRKGHDIDTDELVVSEVYVDEGQRMRRWRPRSRGMANPYTRYTCHMHVTLATPEHVEEKASGRPEWRKPKKRMSQEERLARREAKAEALKAQA
ncbi:50S ribosomal protein L22 [Planctomycetota bacterium]|nr:50S ribosomal protein L22 [Planctomycetota bacterium]